MSLSSPIAIKPTKLAFKAAGVTDIGKVRATNEDDFLIDNENQFWVVADGMGGHASGQIASRLAVESIQDFMTRWRHMPRDDWPFDIAAGQTITEATLAIAAQVANLRIYNRSQSDSGCEGMGTTVVLLHHNDDEGMAVAHVGDSRCYRLRNEHLERLTADHSLAGELTRSKLLTEQEARLHAGSNVILRALGIDDEVRVDVTLLQPQPEDMYLMCSDGLTDLLTDYEIEALLRDSGLDLDQCAEKLVAEANRRGGNDNITVALVQVDIAAKI